MFTLVGWWPLGGKKLSDPYNVKLRVWDWLSKFFGPLVKRASSFTLTDFVTEEREREREREKERKKGGVRRWLAHATAREEEGGGARGNAQQMQEASECTGKMRVRRPASIRSH